MTVQEIQDRLLGLPELLALDLDASAITKSIDTYAPEVVREVATRYDWSFVLETHDHTDGTVASQADYTLLGKHDNARDIINIRYGDNLVLLDERTPERQDEWQTQRAALSDVWIWIPNGREGKSPKITLYGTPSTAGKTLRYRYRRDNVTLQEWPQDFEFVIVSGVASKLFPNRRSIFEADIQIMVDRYESSGGEDDPAIQDPRIISANNRRALKYGYGGFGSRNNT